MRKISLTIFGALLISGSMVQMAAAAEQNKHVTNANLARHHYSDFRGAYNQLRPINASVAPPALYRTDTDGFEYRGFDPSWVGDRDPSLNPSD